MILRVYLFFNPLFQDFSFFLKMMSGEKKIEMDYVRNHFDHKWGKYIPKFRKTVKTVILNDDEIVCQPRLKIESEKRVHDYRWSLSSETQRVVMMNGDERQFSMQTDSSLWDFSLISLSYLSRRLL